jgi:hypothetical protein
MKVRTAHEHIPRHNKVTVQLLNAFAEAPRDTQLETLAQLRGRAADDSHTIELAIAGIAVSILATLTTPAHLNVAHLPWLASLIAGGMLGIIVAVLLVPLLIGSAVRSNRRENATVWLRAYEDELQRRHGQRGYSARKWRASH